MLGLRRLVAGRGFLTVGCLLMVGLADGLFYERVVGWSVGLFALVFLIVMEARMWRLWGMRAGRVVMVLAVVLVAALMEEPTVVGVGLMVMGVGTLAILSEEGWTSSVTRWGMRWGLLWVTMWGRWLWDGVKIERWYMRHPGRRPMPHRMAIRWVLPVMLGGVFVGMFVLANPIISRWVWNLRDEMWAFCDWVIVRVGVGRIVMWVVVGVGTYGILRYRRVKWLPLMGRTERQSVVRIEGGESAWVVRCLVVFNVVFGVQSVLDVIYLWGGAKLPAGMTYAAYAHRGAYPLVGTALLAGMFVMLTFRTGGAAHRRAAARWLVLIWIGQNLFLLASTIWRIVLYVDVYSLTRLRMASMVWVGMVAVGFGWLVWKIVFGKTNVWLCRMNVVTVIGVLYVGAFVNWNGWIAGFNVRHCVEVSGEGVALDVGYMRGLGVEALPAMEWVTPKLPLEEEGRAMDAIRELRAELKGEISDWRGWTWRRGRIAMGERKSIRSLHLAGES